MKLRTTALTAIMATVSFAPAAFAVNHDETFPRMLEMVTSASRAELKGIKDGFCKGQLAATMTASDIRARAAELATEDFTEHQILLPSDASTNIYLSDPHPNTLENNDQHKRHAPSLSYPYGPNMENPQTVAH